MKIAIVASEFPPAVGGMEVHAAQIARFLARSHEVSVIGPALRTPVRDAQGVRVIRILRRQFWSSALQTCHALKRLRPDVLLVLNAGYAILGRAVSYPVVTRVVGNDFLQSWVGPHLPLRVLFWRLPTTGLSPGTWLRGADQRYRNGVVAWGLRSSRRVLANSNFTKSALLRRGIQPAQIDVIVGGVDTTTFHPASRAAARARLGLSEGPVITTCASLTAKKRIDTALAALGVLAPRTPGLTYLVIGDGEEKERLVRLAHDLGIGAHVQFLGRVDHDLLPDYLAASDLYVQSSHIETMGRAACEASACGVPVVATEVGGVSDVVRSGLTGLLVPENDPQALAGAIERLLHDPALRDRIGRQASERAQRCFSWDTVGQRTEHALRAAVAG